MRQPCGQAQGGCFCSGDDLSGNQLNYVHLLALGALLQPATGHQHQITPGFQSFTNSSTILSIPPYALILMRAAAMENNNHNEETEEEEEFIQFSATDTEGMSIKLKFRMPMTAILQMRELDIPNDDLSILLGHEVLKKEGKETVHFKCDRAIIVRNTILSTNDKLYRFVQELERAHEAKMHRHRKKRRDNYHRREQRKKQRQQQLQEEERQEPPAKLQQQQQHHNEEIVVEEQTLTATFVDEEEEQEQDAGIVDFSEEQETLGRTKERKKHRVSFAAGDHIQESTTAATTTAPAQVGGDQSVDDDYEWKQLSMDQLVKTFENQYERMGKMLEMMKRKEEAVEEQETCDETQDMDESSIKAYLSTFLRKKLGFVPRLISTRSLDEFQLCSKCKARHACIHRPKKSLESTRDP